MAKRSRRTARPRVSREKVRENARQGAGGTSWFDLPEGIEQFTPDKAGSILIDVLPYEVKSQQHPDNVEAGVLWWKYPFLVHHGVGATNQSLVCPTSIGKPCPICQEKAKLAKNRDENEEQIKALNPQKYVAYNIVDPDDADKVVVLVLSRGKFAVPLEKELDEGEEGILYFWDVTEEGKTLKVRFSDATFAGHKYIEATRIDFRDRAAMDEDEVLAKVACLDEIFNVMPYDKLKAVFLELGPEEADDEGAERIAIESAPWRAKKTKPAPEPEPDEDDEELEEDEEDLEDEEHDEDEEDAGAGEEEEDDLPEEDEEEDEEDSEDVDDDDEEDDSEDVDDEEAPPPPKKSKTTKAPPKSKKAPAAKAGKGHKCPAGGTFGTDIDKFDECEECEIWAECEEENAYDSAQKTAKSKKAKK
jgi:hypothetical protein